MLVHLTPPHPTSTASPAQQVTTLVGMQISHSAHQLQEILARAATTVSAAVTTSTSAPVGAVIHVGATLIADTAMSVANNEVDQALSAVTDPLGAGISALRDQIRSKISHQAPSIEQELGSASRGTDPTTPSPDGKTPFLSESTGEQFESPQSFGDILFGKGRKGCTGPAMTPETSRCKSIVIPSLGPYKRSTLIPSLAA